MYNISYFIITITILLLICISNIIDDKFPLTSFYFGINVLLLLIKMQLYYFSPSFSFLQPLLCPLLGSPSNL